MDRRNRLRKGGFWPTGDVRFPFPFPNAPIGEHGKPHLGYLECHISDSENEGKGIAVNEGEAHIICQAKELCH